MLVSPRTANARRQARSNALAAVFLPLTVLGVLAVLAIHHFAA